MNLQQTTKKLTDDDLLEQFDRGACGVTAHVVERDGRLAYWRNAFPTCPTCTTPNP